MFCRSDASLAESARTYITIFLSFYCDTGSRSHHTRTTSVSRFHLFSKCFWIVSNCYSFERGCADPQRAAWLGARVFRAHDVTATKRVLQTVAAIRGDADLAVGRRALA